MNAARLNVADMEQVLDLFCECFKDDHYYENLFPDAVARVGQMRQAFHDSIAYCVEHGFSVGITDENRRIIAFALCFDYGKTKRDAERSFYNIFGASHGSALPYYEQIHKPVEDMQGTTLFLLSLAVTPAYRNRGLASCLVDHILREHPKCNIVSDVSNVDSLGIYRNRQFDITRIDEGYYLVARSAERECDPFSSGDKARLLVPGTAALDEFNIPFQTVKKQYVIGYSSAEEFGLSTFKAAPGHICEGRLVSLDYLDLLRYQRLINVSQFQEIICPEYVFYAQIIPYRERPLMNATLADMLPSRGAEWAVVPDVYISIPVQYTDRSRLLDGEEDERVRRFLEYMRFRTNYEAGVPNALEHVDDLASLKQRIWRIYLGKLRLQVSSEMDLSGNDGSMESIGPAALVDMYVSIDTSSDCGVLTLYSLSSPFLVSHLLDNTIRNQLMVREEGRDGKSVNLFNYLHENYKIIKRGTPKSYVVVPREHTCLSADQLASLISSETIYPEGENFGRITDPDILSIVTTPGGMGQYDRATVYAYKNVVLQFSQDLVGSLDFRIGEESITLFYMELILFEEAAIHIANREIVNLFAAADSIEPVRFLKKVDSIYDNYSKTIDFWNIQVNYPSSQKSVTMLRNAFDISGMLEEMGREQEHLRTVFDTKCDIIDRKDSKRMDTSLAIISVLAVFSAWIDGHDYIATWDDVFSGGVIHMLQRLLFLLVLLTALYAITRLFVIPLCERLKAWWNKRGRGK